MSLRMGALYDALRTAQGVSDDDAKNAAEEVAEYQIRMASIDAKLAVIQALLGAIVLMIGGLFWQGFTIMGRLP